MKNRKLIASIGSVIMAATILAGCAMPAAGTAPQPASAPAAAEETAAAEEAPAAEETAAAEEAPAVEETEAAAEEAPAAEETAEWTGDIDEINLILLDIGSTGVNSKPIFDAMNAITEKSCGVRANVEFAGMSDYTTRVTLAMSGNEDVDIISLVPMAPANFGTLIANGQLLDITEYVEEYGQGLKEVIGDYFTATTLNGSIYGVPTYHNFASFTTLIMRKDVLDELGLTEKAQNATKWSEIEEIFTEVKDKTGLSPLCKTIYQKGTVFGEDAFADVTTFDALGDSFNAIFVDENGTVSPLADNQEFKDNCDLMKKWFDGGLVYKDSIITDEHQDTLMKDGTIFAYVDTAEIGVEAYKKQSTGYDVICLEVGRAPLQSLPVQNLGLAVPITSDNPEAAVRWMNELYTNPDLSNLITFGIEGEDYIVENGEAKYPEGTDAQNVRYHMADYMFGNYFIEWPWEGQGADFRERSLEDLNSTEISPFMGFAVNLNGMDNVVAGINSVYMEYNKQITYGGFTEETYENYRAALSAAGIDDYVACYQEQLDAWKAGQ